jgi:quercetin dioxygenase-like cupin family protein
MGLDSNVLTPLSIDEIDVRTKVIVANEKFKTIFFNFVAGSGKPYHTYNGYASVQVYEGIIIMEFKTGEKFRLKKGDFIPFDARIDHNIVAEVDSKVLVTISEALS